VGTGPRGRLHAPASLAFRLTSARPLLQTQGVRGLAAACPQAGGRPCRRPLRAPPGLRGARGGAYGRASSCDRASEGPQGTTREHSCRVGAGAVASQPEGPAAVRPVVSRRGLNPSPWVVDAPFPAPASSNRACGSPAHGSPTSFTAGIRLSPPVPAGSGGNNDSVEIDQAELVG